VKARWVHRAIGMKLGNHPKNAVFLLLALCIVQWVGVAASRSDSSSVLPDFLVHPCTLTHAEAIVYPWPMLGGALAIADFDGDDKADSAIGRLSENQYGIVIHLSSHPGVTVLRASAPPAGFALLAFDINKDSFPDIVVTSPTALHPLAVWLGDGKGGFTAADQTGFENACGLSTSPKYDRRNFSFQHNLLTEPSRPVCEKPVLAFGDSGPERNGFITSRSNLHALRNICFLLTPRSPPIDLPI
jgi:hypothetical protein